MERQNSPSTKLVLQRVSDTDLIFTQVRFWLCEAFHHPFSSELHHSFWQTGKVTALQIWEMWSREKLITLVLQCIISRHFDIKYVTFLSYPCRACQSNISWYVTLMNNFDLWVMINRQADLTYFFFCNFQIS